MMRAPFVFESGLPDDFGYVTPSDSRKVRLRVVKDWHYGPQPGQAPDAFYASLASIWGVDPDEAKRHSCMNCEEYHYISPEAQAKMEGMPVDAWDANAGPRVFCEKFGFISHASRVCQAWEDEPEEEEEKD